MLSPGLDLLDLSEPITPTQSKGKKSEPVLKGDSSKGQSIKKKVDETDLIKSEAERSTKTVKIPEKASLDLGNVCIAIYLKMIHKLRLFKLFKLSNYLCGYSLAYFHFLRFWQLICSFSGSELA